MNFKVFALAGLLLSLAACGSGPAEEAGPIGAKEEQAIKQAAEMLEDTHGTSDRDTPAATNKGDEREGL